MRAASSCAGNAASVRASETPIISWIVRYASADRAACEWARTEAMAQVVLCVLGLLTGALGSSPNAHGCATASRCAAVGRPSPGGVAEFARVLALAVRRRPHRTNSVVSQGATNHTSRAAGACLQPKLLRVGNPSALRPSSAAGVLLGHRRRSARGALERRWHDTGRDSGVAWVQDSFLAAVGLT